MQSVEPSNCIATPEESYFLYPMHSKPSTTKQKLIIRNNNRTSSNLGATEFLNPNLSELEHKKTLD